MLRVIENFLSCLSSCKITQLSTACVNYYYYSTLYTYLAPFLRYMMLKNSDLEI